MNIPKSPIFLTIIIEVMTGCATSSLNPFQTERPIIVRQADTSDAIIDSHSRTHWVNVRKGQAASEVKTYATLATGSWSAAETEARHLLQLHPNQEDALIILATSLAMQKKFALAAYYARIYERKHRATSETLNIQGLALLTSNATKLSDFRRAAELFQQAMQENSAEIAAGLNLGQLFLELGDAQNAAETFQEVKKRCRECLPSLIGSGVALSRLKKLGSARDEFRLALKIKPHHPQALYRLALIAQQNDHDLKAAKRYLDELFVYTSENDYLIRQKAEALVRALDAEDDRSKAVRKAQSLTDDKNENEQIDSLLNE